MQCRDRPASFPDPWNSHEYKIQGCSRREPSFPRLAAPACAKNDSTPRRDGAGNGLRGGVGAWGVGGRRVKTSLGLLLF